MASEPQIELLVHRVDKLARSTPDAIFAEFPVSQNVSKAGFYKVTYGILANAVNAVAWWLESTLGKSNSVEALAYIGPNDIRYAAFALGALKAGYVVSQATDMI
jgi:acyl-CoA synthetase (AMP-forming)/AMP-acid ligase II